MEALVIKGPAKLNGSVKVHGSKNAALPLLFASLLFDEEVSYENVPRLWDIETTLHLLKSMGVSYVWDKDAGTVKVNPTVTEKVASYEWVSRMRAGILALGPLVARYGVARVSLPGGCAIGARPVNYHLEALTRLGAEVKVDGGYVIATVDRLRGAEIDFPEVSVTGTENLLYVAAVAEGTTQIRNAAREPEVIALGEFLNSCGAKITGLGTSCIEVRGVSKLEPPKQAVRVGPDRIETGTWIAAAAATKSDLKITNCDASQLTSVLSAFRDMGIGIEVSEDQSEIFVHKTDEIFPLRLETSPYPGFATDMQAQILTVMCGANGRSQIRETIFENRFMHVAELRRLGAKINIRKNTATVHGPVPFVGAPLMATDLRASASLVVAALRAEGETVIRRIYHLDRGYQRLDVSLRALGVDVRRIEE